MTAPPSPSFDHVSAVWEKDVLVLTFLDRELTGEDLVYALRTELLTAVHDAQVRNVVLDLQHVRFLGSAAIRPFLAIQQQLQQRGGRVILCGLDPVLSEVMRVMRLIEQAQGIAGLFKNASDVQAALACLAQ